MKTTYGVGAATVFSELDREAMARALLLAERGLETTHPNPRVGCVIAKDGQILGEGWHERAGEPHAEVHALRAAGERARGATAYVTLEPCNHHGRTPPCVDAIIAAGVTNVIFAVDDPNPLVRGHGAKQLREAGISVESGLMEAEAMELNPGFMKRMKLGTPWVRVKLAMSLDGRTALDNGASRWITGEAARSDVQRWRARSSVIMTGVGTILTDDPLLDVRLPGSGLDHKAWQPRRVVLDSSLLTPASARLLTAGNEVLVLTIPPAGTDVTWTSVHETRRRALEARGARVEVVPVAAGRPALRTVLERLARLEANEVLIEAGPRLAGAFLSQGLVDELLLYVAPKILGPQARPLVELPQLLDLQQARGFVLIEVQRVGEDLRLRLRPP